MAKAHNSRNRISMRVDPQMDAQLNKLQTALNLDMSAVIRLAVALLYRQAQREGWVLPDPDGAGEQAAQEQP